MACWIDEPTDDESEGKSIVVAQADSLIVPQSVLRPGSFTGLMTLYESNYIRLGMLGPIAAQAGFSAVSRVPGDCDLHVSVMLHERYTTTMRMTYIFEEPRNRIVSDPDLTIRIYHDARLVEAVTGAQRHRHHMLREWARRTHEAELDRRWQRNIMLNKWLEYLQDVGHGFS